jgi:hypothetical protein
MQKPYLSASALVALCILSWGHPALAQHRGATAHAKGSKAAAAPHVNQGSVQHANAQEAKMMQQQMEREQKFMMQRQAQMAEMENKAHQQRIQGFNEFLKSNPASTASNKTGTASTLPESPRAFAAWYNTQKHNKARNKSYDPAYDQFRAFEKSQGQTSTTRQAHRMATTGSSTTGSTATTNAATTSPTTTVPASSGSSTNHSTTAAAQQSTGTHQQTHGLAAVGSSANRLPWAADQAIISHLRTAHSRLQQAERDYQGHRARAATHIVTALRTLGASSLQGLNIPPGQNQMAQGQSDAMIRDVLFRLNTAQGQMSSRNNLASHQVNARTQITQAIQELNVALNVR